MTFDTFLHNLLFQTLTLQNESIENNIFIQILKMFYLMLLFENCLTTVEQANYFKFIQYCYYNKNII